jgi:glyoxylase-like metal-dependent hydrolase (beta-lactamase superfamily II)
VDVTHPRPVQVADGVYFVRGVDVNWVLLRDGTDVTLVDAGYPGYVDSVEDTVRAIGSSPEDVRAILVTHAHIDHIGAVNAFHAKYATPVYLDPVEVGHAHREYEESAGPVDVLKNAWRPGVLPWALRIARAGATQDVVLDHAQPFPTAGPLDLPGRPTPVATHGHTSGHSAFHLADSGVVITGDGLITGHAVSLVSGPQVIAPWFNHGDAVAGLAPLEPLAADILLPGHGTVHRGPIADAVARARERLAKRS